MGNLDLYNKVRIVPNNAQKQILGGRLKGMTDINPMWRIQTLTETYGQCGIGWWTSNIQRQFVDGANGEKIVLCDLDLFILDDGKPSEAIHGTGGAMFVTNEKNGAYTDDECFKKAYTDAISVACKALGIGADVYWAQGTTKYSAEPERRTTPIQRNTQNNSRQYQTNVKSAADSHAMSGSIICSKCKEPISENVANYCKGKNMPLLCYKCQKEPQESEYQESENYGDSLGNIDFERLDDQELPWK